MAELDYDNLRWIQVVVGDSGGPELDMDWALHCREKVDLFWLAPRPRWAYPSSKHADKANIKALKEKQTKIKQHISDRLIPECQKWFLYWWYNLLSDEIKKSSFKIKNNNNHYDLEAIKSVPVERVLRDLGIRSFKNRWFCPFHNDRNIGSFQVFPKTNSCWCFSCQKGGSVIDLVVNNLGLSVGEAIKWLKNHY